MSDAQLRAAQFLTGATIVAWLACGLIPAVARYATRVRAALLVAYLLGCAVVLLAPPM